MCSLFLSCGHQPQQSPSMSWCPSAEVSLLWRVYVCICVCVHYSCSKSVFAEEYEKHYREVSQLGEGGFGTVFSGYRRHDLFPVAIKHIAKDLVKYQPVINGELHCAPLEMVLMVMTAGDSVGENAVVSPLAWIDLDDEILLIMERPENCMNLFEYDNEKNSGFSYCMLLIQ
uniref:non-specific serine/threonine protein kinase n=1 Tax=Takifugu rubripes TaxID=31033 RepID=A0A674NUV3_TAKRU